ncbi:MAG: Multidrug resistance efflux pump [Verrucomicrobiales bacterium]|nr:Multidrug resistance efflux pump [Verrucomicrobiales bacterium]
MKALNYFLALVLVLSLAGCKRKSDDLLQGYVEGEYVYVASPLAGTLESLSVQRGAQVNVHDNLFALDSVAEIAGRDQAARRLEEAEAKAADSKKGMRSSEMESLEAQVKQAGAALVLSEKEFTRQSELEAARTSTVQDLDRARAARDQDRQRLSRSEAELKTAQLGARSDRVTAAEANVRALAAALSKAEWDLSQKHQLAPQSALVFDTIYQQGEWVPAGRPVVSLLPPGNIKVRAFVPENRLGGIHLGDSARVFVDGAGSPITGTVRFISPQAEYTPPVIYSQQTCGKLVFMVELKFDPLVAASLHPGQPVDVQF